MLRLLLPFLAGAAVGRDPLHELGLGIDLVHLPSVGVDPGRDGEHDRLAVRAGCLVSTSTLPAAFSVWSRSNASLGLPRVFAFPRCCIRPSSTGRNRQALLSLEPDLRLLSENRHLGAVHRTMVPGVLIAPATDAIGVQLYPCLAERGCGSDLHVVARHVIVGLHGLFQA